MVERFVSLLLREFGASKAVHEIVLSRLNRGDIVFQIDHVFEFNVLVRMQGLRLGFNRFTNWASKPRNQMLSNKA